MTIAAGSPSWAIRRRIILGTLGYCALSLAWPIARGDAVMVDSLVSSYAMLVSAIIGAYVFGAAYEDVSKYRVNGGAGAVLPDPREEIYSE